MSLVFFYIYWFRINRVNQLGKHSLQLEFRKKRKLSMNSIGENCSTAAARIQRTLEQKKAKL